ncbi:MAG: IctB family putative bicarbonate transporter [Thermoleophilia bacterium]
MTPLDFDKFGEVKSEVSHLLFWAAALYFPLLALARGSFGMPRSPVLPLLALLALQGLVATLLSDDPVVGVMGNLVRFDGYLMLLANGTFFLIAYDFGAGGRRESREMVVAAVALAALPVWLYGLIQATGHDPYVWESFRDYGGRVFSTLGNPIFLGAFTTMALTLSFAAALEQRGAKRWAWGLFAGVGMAVLVLTGTRAAWVAAAFALLVFFAWGLRVGQIRRVSWLLVVVVLVAVGLLGSLRAGATAERQSNVVSAGVESMLDPEHERNSGRLAIWQISGRMISDHPLTGVGPDEMALHFEAYRTDAFDAAEGSGKIADKPHSVVLEWAVETGVPGAVLFLAFVGTVFWGAVRSICAAPERESWLMIGLLAGAVAYFAQGLVTVTAIGVDGVWWILLGLLAGAAVGRAEVPFGEGNEAS